MIEQFDANYEEMCDNKKMNVKQRGVSKDNPFEHSNKPPREHLVPDKILDKPGAIKDIKSLGDNRPLAGRFSEIGERIFTLGGKKASHLCTGPWGEIQMLDGASTRKKVKPIPNEPNKCDYVPGENHASLHKLYVPPAYLTQPGVTYTGSRNAVTQKNTLNGRNSSPVGTARDLGKSD